MDPNITIIFERLKILGAQSFPTPQISDYGKMQTFDTY